MNPRKISHQAIFFMIMAAIIITILLGVLLIYGLDKNISWHVWWPHFSLDEMIFWIRDAGNWSIAISILLMIIHSFIPVIAFNLINYAAGLANVSLWTFLWTTGVGILPLTGLMVIMGDKIHTHPWTVWLILLFVGLLIWLALHWYIYPTRYGFRLNFRFFCSLPLLKLLTIAHYSSSFRRARKQNNQKF